VTTSAPSDETPTRRPPAHESRYAKVFGWVTVVSTGMLLGSGLFDALRHGLPSRWGQAAAFTIFVLAHVGTVGRKRPPIARALASLLYLGFVLEAYWFTWGIEDATVFAWSNLTLEAVRDGLLLWSLGLGALVLTLAPPQPHTKLLGAMLGLFLMLPWIWGLSRGSSRLTIIEGPQWLDWGWYIQPAFLGLALLLPVALIALIETAYKVRGMGTLEHGVMVGLGFLSLAPLGLFGLHQFTPDLVQPAAQLTEADIIDGRAANHQDRAEGSAHSAHQPRKTHGGGGENAGLTSPDSDADALPVAWSLEASDDLASCSGSIVPDSPLADLKAAFQAEQWQPITTLVLRRRYPAASWVVSSLKDPAHLRRNFPSPPVTWRRIVLGASSAIYESVRMVGFQRINEISFSYPIGEDRMLEVPRLNLFPRSEVWNSLPKPVRDLRMTTLHFEGDPGTRHLEDILDHLNAYTWSLLTEIALLDQTVGRDIAARDALLASLAYTDAYLTYARNNHPGDYRTIVETEAMRAAVIFLWDRAVCALRLSGTEARLGIEDVALVPVVFRAEKPPAVDLLRKAAGEGATQPGTSPEPGTHSPTDHNPPADPALSSDHTAPGHDGDPH
jgi:hypothetical protein